ncbi:hypothetical protein MKW98_031899 [Papaver atlanticum]|uniref:Uncharacterized protein n=1 Tax=Papaver atlanticum TaxID=357466 RepID=A0AAD4SFC5_9MAGN|nr:hypothetical protein MKW98_031899 [Papaver atlanticum]
MEAGKYIKAPLGAMIMSVLILGLFIVQTSVEALPSFTNTESSEECYWNFRVRKSPAVCQKRCNYLMMYHRPLGYNPSEQTNVADQAYQINEYCKLGCVSCKCGDNITITTPQKYDNKEVERCNNTCLELCNKHCICCYHHN